MSDTLISLTFLLVIGCGLVAGIFFAFTNLIMAALRNISPEHGISAMQAINITVINLRFLSVFLGTGLGCLVLTILTLMGHGGPYTLYLLMGSVLYLLGSILVTIVFNIPLNDSLATVDANSTQGAKAWARYLSTWTRWNNVRTVSSFAAMISFLCALT